MKLLPEQLSFTWTAGTVVPTLIGTNNWALKTVGTAAGNLLDKAAGDTLYEPVIATLSATKLPALTGDITSSAGSAATTLATVNANTGAFGSTSVVPVITVNAKGLITAVSTATITPAAIGAAPTASPTFTGTLNAAAITATGAITGSNLSGTNTGDQTNITGNAGTATILAAYRTFYISGGGITAQAAIAFNGSANINLNASVDAGHITLARMADVATGTLFYRKTAGTGIPEIQTLATLKTDLGLTGTNSGDQTTITGNAGSATILQTARLINGTSFNGSADITITAANPNALTFSNGGAGGASGTTYTGSAAQTISYNSIGAAPNVAFSSSTMGLVPNPVSSTGRYLKDDGTWASVAAGTGTVTSVSVVTANGISGSVATATTTPAITLTLGAITPTSVTATTVSADTLTATGGMSIAPVGSLTLSSNGSSVLNGSSTGLTVPSGKNLSVSGSTASLAPFSIPHGVAVTSAFNGDIWTTTAGLFIRVNAATKTVAFTDSAITGNAGSATILQTGRTLAITGDLAWTSPTFDGSGNVTAAGTLATVNSNVGSFGSATAVPIMTVNAKGLVTAVSTAALGTSAAKNTGTSGNTVPLLDGVNTWSGAQTFSSSVTINGDLTVAGTTTAVNATNLEVSDAIITLARNNSTGAATYIGVKAERGSAGNDAYAVWDEGLDQFKFQTAADDAMTTPVTVPVAASRFVSDIATGTAPLAVTSTTVVTNLNADLLDGQDGTYYTNASNLGSGTILAARMPAHTGDVTTSAGSVATTLATVNSNVGAFGSATVVPTVTVNAKGLVTAVTTNTITPAGIGAAPVASPVFTTLATVGGVSYPKFLVKSSTTGVGAGAALELQDGAGSLIGYFGNANGVDNDLNIEAASKLLVTASTGIDLQFNYVTKLSVVTGGVNVTGALAATGAVSGSNLSGTNTGDQTNITGNAGTATTLQTSRNFSITGGGITAAAVGFNGSAVVALSASVDNGHITLARMANVPALSIIGNNTGAAAVGSYLTTAQTTAMLDLFNSTTKGLVPLSGGGTTNFLRADGTWAAPPGGGGTTTQALTFNNGGIGAASGTTFNGASAQTISYNSIGAAPTASPTFTGTLTAVDVNITNSLFVQTPNSGTTGAIRLKGNATSGFGYLQFLNSAADTEWGYLRASSGALYLGFGSVSTSSTMNVGASLVAQIGTDGQVIVGNDGVGSIEIGKQGRAVASSPYIDFHSSAGSPDFDARIQATGGTASSGFGTLTYTAATHTFTGTVSAVNWFTATDGAAAALYLTKTGTNAGTASVFNDGALHVKPGTAQSLYLHGETHNFINVAQNSTYATMDASNLIYNGAQLYVGGTGGFLAQYTGGAGYIRTQTGNLSLGCAGATTANLFPTQTQFLTDVTVQKTAAGAQGAMLGITNVSNTIGTEAGIFFGPNVNADRVRSAQIVGINADGGNGTKLVFRTNVSGGGPTTQMTIDQNGVVFVKDIYATRTDGTTGVIFLGAGSAYLYFDGSRYNMPTYPLSVGGNITAPTFVGALSGNASTASAINGWASSPNSYGACRLYRKDTNDQYNVQTNYDGSRWLMRGYNGDTFHAECRVSFADSALSAGQLNGVNASSYARYDAGGNFTVGQNFVSTQNTSYVGQAGTLVAYGSGTTAATMSFHRSGAYAVNVGLDTDNIFRIGGWSMSASALQLDGAGNLTALGNIGAYSDATLKENVETISDALTKVCAMRGVTFDVIASGARSSGVIAQEFEPHAPELVATDADGIKSVMYGNTAGYFIEAFKEMKGMLDEQALIIEEMRAEIAALKGAR